MNGSSRQKYTHVSQLITSNPQMTQLRQKQQNMIMMIKKLKRRIKETLPEAQRTQKLTPRLGLNLATTWRHLH